MCLLCKNCMNPPLSISILYIDYKFRFAIRNVRPQSSLVYSILVYFFAPNGLDFLLEIRVL